MKVLLVSDAAQGESLIPEFRGRGWEVASSSDVPSALATARRVAPQVVVASERLPGGGGTVLVTRLRALLGTALTPVVGLVAGSVAEGRMTEAGASVCVAADAGPVAVADAVERADATPGAPALEVPVEVLSEPTRLATIEQTGLIPGDEDAAFDDITRVASDLLPAPTSLVSLVEAEGQFFPGRTDVAPRAAGGRGTPLAQSFCQWAVASGESLVVEDATRHQVLRENPAVGEQHVQAYAGVPLVVDGTTLGTVCAVDYEARGWDDEDLAHLQLLGQLATAELRVRLAQHGHRDWNEPGRLVGAVKDGVGAVAGLFRTARPQPDSVAHVGLVRLLERFNRRLQTWSSPGTAADGRVEA